MIPRDVNKQRARDSLSNQVILRASYSEWRNHQWTVN